MIRRHKFFSLLSVFLILIILGSIFPINLFAQERVGSIKGDNVNIRTGPDTSYASLAKINKGQAVTIMGEKNNWFQVRLTNGVQGWVAGWLVEEQLSSSNTAVVTGDIVNIRKGNGTNSPKVGQVKAGEFVIVVKSQNNWSYVKLTNGTEGWIANWLITGNTASMQIGYINGMNVNVRQNNGTTYPVLFQLNKGEQVIIKEKKGDWYLVDTVKGSGWVAAWLVTIPGGLQADRGSAVITANSSQASGKLAGKTIVLDPGHGSIQPGGWADPGAVGKTTGIKERDINLDIAFKLQQYLIQQGAKVIMTHSTGNTYLSLTGRADIANKNGVDIFVSIHVNSNNLASYAGTSVYFYAPSGNAQLASQRWLRQKLAQAVQSELINAAGRKDLGIMEANFAVLRETKVPSILVETAFVSNPEEERLLNTNDFRNKLAWGIYKGIEKYFNSL